MNAISAPMALPMMDPSGAAVGVNPPAPGWGAADPAGAQAFANLLQPHLMGNNDESEEEE